MRHTTITLPNAINFQFSFKDIEKALFQNINPHVTTYPFSFKSLKNVSITFEVPFLVNESVTIKDVIRWIKKVNGKSMRAEVFLSIPLILIPYLMDAFMKQHQLWKDYVVLNIGDFCKEEISLFNWYTLKSSEGSNVFEEKMGYLQKLWITLNVSRDREFWIKFATDIRESLLPWMNNELWTKIAKLKETTRENVLYEEQRKAMKEGRIQDIGIAQEMSPEELKEELNDLDIIV